MCTRPITIDEKTFACRACDACIANRRHQWVARSMAEATQWKHSLSITLTYGNETQEQRDSAAMFCYADVRSFMARLRDAAFQAEKKAGRPRPVIRFLCAGEQGEQNGRCHWHMILFSDVDLTRLGKITRFGRLVEKLEIWTFGKKKRRCHWSLWGMGFVTFQEFDEGAAHYVLSYALKDQFTGEKSVETAREVKSENFATGLFRMSKRPAIGEAWLLKKMENHLVQGDLPVSLKFRVPGLSGYWVPSGVFRKRALWLITAVNQLIFWRTGKPAPQWGSLLSTLTNLDADMEILIASEKQEEEAIEDVLARRDVTSREDARFARYRGCVNELPCAKCLQWLDPDKYEELGIEPFERESPYQIPFRSLSGYAEIGERITGGENGEYRLGGLNPYCIKRGFKEARILFPQSGKGD